MLGHLIAQLLLQRRFDVGQGMRGRPQGARNHRDLRVTATRRVCQIHFKILPCDAAAWLAQAHLVSAAILFGSIGFQAPSSLTLKLSAASTASSAWTLA